MNTLRVGQLYKTKDGRNAFIYYVIDDYYYGVIEGVNCVMIYTERGVPVEDKFFEVYGDYIDLEKENA